MSAKVKGKKALAPTLLEDVNMPNEFKEFLAAFSHDTFLLNEDRGK